MRDLQRQHAERSDRLKAAEATAADLRALIVDVKARVADATGFVLEEEVVYAGQW